MTEPIPTEVGERTIVQHGRHPTEVAKELGVSTSTLRQWSLHLSDYLSRNHEQSESDVLDELNKRLYSDADVQVLAELQGMLEDGLTLDEARTQLKTDSSGSIVDSDDIEEPEPNDEKEVEEILSLVQQKEDEGDGPDIAKLVAAALSSLSDSQRIILSGQQTERQLLGVLLQDNFNLKEENTRLRERMIDTERRVFELKRSLDESSSTERERMRQMEAQLFELQRRLDALSQQRAAFRQVTTPEPSRMPIVVESQPPVPAQLQATSSAAQAPQSQTAPSNDLALGTVSQNPNVQPNAGGSDSGESIPAQNAESAPQKRGFWQWLLGR